MQVQPVAKISTLSDPVLPFLLTNFQTSEKIELHYCSIHLHLVPILRRCHYFCISLYELDFLITKKVPETKRPEELSLLLRSDF